MLGVRRAKRRGYQCKSIKTIASVRVGEAGVDTSFYYHYDEGQSISSKEILSLLALCKYYHYFAHINFDLSFPCP